VIVFIINEALNDVAKVDKVRHYWQFAEAQPGTA
jgi:hypothetical protein